MGEDEGDRQSSWPHPPPVDRSDGPKVAEKSEYRTISLTKGVSDAIDEIMKELGYWPSRGAFVREAALEKIQKERTLIQRLGSHGGRRSGARNRSVGETGQIKGKTKDE